MEKRKLVVDEWAKVALKQRGIEVLKDGTLQVTFTKGKVQIVKDLPAAIRQQKHIIDQQKEEQKENEEIGILMRQFHDLVVGLDKMTVEQFTERKKNNTLKKLEEILETMSRKREDLRKDGYNRLKKVYKMLESGNIPAANTTSLAALNRMRKRWLVNEKVIDKSYARLEALKNLAQE